MRSVLPDLTIAERKSQRAAVTAARKGCDETHWVYDHLPLALWRGEMTEEKCAKYDTVFEKAEPYVPQVRGFVRQIYPYTMRSLELCAALIYWRIMPTLEATYFLTRWLLPFDILNWRTLRSTVDVCSPPLLNDKF